MKTNNLIIKLILLFSFVTSGCGAPNYYLDPTISKAGKSFTVYYDANTDISSTRKIKLMELFLL